MVIKYCLLLYNFVKIVKNNFHKKVEKWDKNIVYHYQIIFSYDQNYLDLILKM